MVMEIECPEEFQGAVVGNVSSRRGMITSTDSLEGLHEIRADVPLAETFGYSTDLRSMTQGQGTFTMELYELQTGPASCKPRSSKSGRKNCSRRDGGSGQ